MTRAIAGLTIVVGAASVLAVQPPPASTGPTPSPASNTLSAEAGQAADRVGSLLLKTADRMPENLYRLQVVPDIPSFAATLGEAIDFRLRTCAEISGSDAKVDAASMRVKADLMAAMRRSMAECEKVFAGLSDATVVQVTAGPAGDTRSRLSALYGMVAHDREAFGALALHLRLKGIEPPSGNGGAAR